jgi:hypothetical protein
MFYSTKVEASGNGLSALMTHGHVSSESPSTHLFSLSDLSCSLQARWASRVAAS